MGTLVAYSLLFVSLYFEVFLLVSYIERQFIKKAIAVSMLLGDLPRVAIVVPSYNEGASVQGTLRSLLALEYPKDKLEIIVVDDGSSDDTYAQAKAFESDPRVRVFAKENGGK